MAEMLPPESIVEIVQHGLAVLGEHEAEVAGALMTARAAGIGFRWVRSAVGCLLPILERRYLGTSAAAQTAAAANVVAVSESLKAAVDEYVASGRLIEKQGRAALDDPAFAVFFNDRILDASETNDPFMHETLAKMVVERMTKTSGTSEAILISIAASRLRDLGPRQLRLIGAIFVAEHVFVEPFVSRGSSEADFDFYTEQCAIEVRPHWDAQLISQDFDHLDSLSLIELSQDRFKRRMFGGGTQAPMLATALQEYPARFAPGTRQPEVYQRLHSWIEGAEAIAFKYVQLKSPGWIIGAVVHAHLRGQPLDLGKWV